jgi:acetyl esterase
MPVDPLLEQLLPKLAPAGPAPYERLDFEALRREVRRPRLPTGPAVRLEQATFPGPGGELALRGYRPPGAKGQLGGLVFFGGALAFGEMDGDDALCRELALGAECAVVAVDYRLAPEHPFPAAVDDAYAACCFIHEHADQLGIDHRRLAVGGHTGGAALATAVARLAKERRNPALVFQLLVYPLTDLRGFETPSQLEHGARGPLTRGALQRFAEAYASSAAVRADPRCSPLAAKNLIGLPAALLVTAECDPLRDEGEAYAAALSGAQVPVTLRRYPGMPHGFLALCAELPLARQALDECAAALGAALQPR